MNRQTDAAPPLAGAPCLMFSVEKHVNGWAIYRGGDSQHHGMKLGHLTECESGVPEMIEDALNERLERMLSANTEVSDIPK